MTLVVPFSSPFSHLSLKAPNSTGDAGPDHTVKDISALFNEALDHADAAARTHFLDQACGADSALRERLEILLKSHREAGVFLAHPSSNPAGSAAVAPGLANSLMEKAGDRIGRYKLLEPIGEGGCGV